MDFMDRIRKRSSDRRIGAWLESRAARALMSQHDYNLANASGASFRSDANDALGAIVTWNSGATAPATTFARMRWADTTSGTIKRRNAANSGWLIESTDDEARVVDRSSNTILDESDIGKTFRATASFTQTFTAAATLGDGWWCAYRVESGFTLTLDPNSTENIDGATTKAITGPNSGFIVCNGSAFYTIGFAGSAPGTWTPKIQDTSASDAEGQTYATQVGWYHKIGGILWFGGIVTMTSLGTLSTALRLAGLPFSAKNTTGHFGGLWVPRAAGLAITAGQNITGTITAGDNFATLNLWDSAAGTSGLAVAELSDDGSLEFVGFMEVD